MVKAIPEIKNMLGLPESAGLQIQFTPGDSQGGMEERVGFVTFFLETIPEY